MPGLFRLCQQFLTKLMKLRGKVSMLSDANQNWIFKCWTASRIWFSIPHLTGPLANGGAREGLRTLNMGRGTTPRVPAQPRHRRLGGVFSFARFLLTFHHWLRFQGGTRAAPCLLVVSIGAGRARVEIHCFFPGVQILFSQRRKVACFDYSCWR